MFRGFEEFPCPGDRSLQIGPETSCTVTFKQGSLTEAGHGTYDGRANLEAQVC